MSRRRHLVAVAVLALVPSATASAQVHVDPGSPTGKEYGIPLENARHNAARGANGSSDLNSQEGSDATQSSAPAPLFGEGLGPAASGQRAQRTSANGSRSSVDRAIAGAQPVRATVPAGDAKSTLTVAALALSVLLLGGVLGSIARRRRS